MYKFYDKIKEKWLSDIFISDNGVVYRVLSIAIPFVSDRLSILSPVGFGGNSKHLCMFKPTNHFDSKYNRIYEGDFLEVVDLKNYKYIFEVVYWDKTDSWILFDTNTYKVYTFRFFAEMKSINIIGNTVDTPLLVKLTWDMFWDYQSLRSMKARRKAWKEKMQGEGD